MAGIGLRHAAPWSRKISATSSAGREMALLRRRLIFPALLFGFLGLLRGATEGRAGFRRWRSCR